MAQPAISDRRRSPTIRRRGAAVARAPLIARHHVMPVRPSPPNMNLHCRFAGSGEAPPRTFGRCAEIGGSTGLVELFRVFCAWFNLVPGPGSPGGRRRCVAASGREGRPVGNHSLPTAGQVTRRLAALTCSTNGTMHGFHATD
jgi:hypothetical protein